MDRARDLTAMSPDRATIIIVALLLAPVPLILVVSILRGYTVTIHMQRRDRDR